MSTVKLILPPELAARLPKKKTAGVMLIGAGRNGAGVSIIDAALTSPRRISGLNRSASRIASLLGGQAVHVVGFTVEYSPSFVGGTYDAADWLMSVLSSHITPRDLFIRINETLAKVAYYPFGLQDDTDDDTAVADLVASQWDAAVKDMGVDDGWTQNVVKKPRQKKEAAVAS